MKIVNLLVITWGLIFFIGCDSRSKAPDKEQVDFIGIWNYSITYKNGRCDHLTAKGTINITVLDDNVSKIGYVMRKGDKFVMDKDRSCKLSQTEDTNDAFLGHDRNFTKDSYLQYLKNFYTGNKVLVSVNVTEFSKEKIVVKEKFSNGALIIFEYRR